MYSLELRKEYPNERIAKTLIRLIFVKRIFSLQSSDFIFEKKLTVWISIRTQHTRPPSAVRPVLLWPDHFFVEYAFLVGSFFQFPLDFLCDDQSLFIV